MKERQARRIIISLPAELICGDRRYAGSIENLSPVGAYVVTAPAQSSLYFTPHAPVELRFELPSGEKLDLHCTVKWSYATPPHGYTHSIGLEIIDPPLTYQETLTTL